MKKWATIAVCVLAVFALALFVVADLPETMEYVLLDNFLGIQGVSNPTSFSRDLSYAQDIVNFDIVRSGPTSFLKQRDGFNVVGKSRSSSPPFLIGAYPLSSGSTLLFNVSRAGNVYYCASLNSAWTRYGGADHIVTSDAAGAFISYAVIKDTLCVFSDSAFKFSGTSLAGGAVWGYHLGVFHKDRIYAAGGYWADAEIRNKVIYQPEFDIDFDSLGIKTNSGFFYVGNEDGDYITDVEILGEYLIFYKTTKTYRGSISSVTNTPDEITLVSDDIGVPNNNCVTSYGGFHYIVNGTGVYVFDGNSFQKISGNIDFHFRDSLGFDDYDSHLGIASMNGRLYVAVHSGRYLVTKASLRCFVYDIESRTWTKYTMPMEWSICSFAQSTTDFTTYGSSRGGLLAFSTRQTSDTSIYVWPSDRYDTGQSVYARYLSPKAYFGDLWNRKRISEVSTIFHVGGAADNKTFTVSFYSDSGLSDSKAITFNSGLYGNGAKYRHQRPQTGVEGTALGFEIETGTCDSLQLFGIGFAMKRVGPSDWR